MHNFVLSTVTRIFRTFRFRNKFKTFVVNIKCIQFYKDTFVTNLFLYFHDKNLVYINYLCILIKIIKIIEKCLNIFIY